MAKSAGSFAPGHKKAGGRKKGTPNKITQDVVTQLEALGFNPLSKLVKAVLDIEAAIEKQTKEQKFVSIGLRSLHREALADVMQYAYPKRKAIDHTTGGQSINSLTALMESCDEEAEDDEPGSKT